jgi:hypothetical protein
MGQSFTSGDGTPGVTGINNSNESDAGPGVLGQLSG